MMMKKIIILVSVLFVASSCDDEFYTEGRIETKGVTEIGANSAVLNGSVEIAFEGKYARPSIVCGFEIWSDDASSSRVGSTQLNGGSFNETVTNLSPNTKYYVKAYATVSHNVLDYDGHGDIEDDWKTSSSTYYGNVIEFTTADGDAPLSYVELKAAGIGVQRTDVSSSFIDWTSAKSLCDNSIVGNLTDWRLPTINELATLYSNRSIIGGFRSDYRSVYWSSSAMLNASGYYYQINFSDGSQHYDYINSSFSGETSIGGYLFYARCVRTLTN